MMMKHTPVALIVAFTLAACPQEEPPPPPVEAVCTEPTPVDPLCVDATFTHLEMNLDTVSDGLIENEDVDGAFLSHVDATAGGAFGGGEAFIYGRFTDDGMEKVEVLDIDSFESMDWDIAFRRFVVRLNSGDSGPSCVSGARTPPDTTFADLNEVIDGLEFNAEDFITPPESCDLIPDGSGLPNSPGVVLQNYWTYPGCVQMTGNVYVVRLASGRHVKLEVLSYYSPDVQEECDTTNSIDLNGPTGSGNIRLQWAFLD